MKYPIIFALLTALCWGLYGPVLGYSRSQLASPFKPYVAIGIAYLIWGVLGGLIGMYFKGDDFSFSGAGAKWGIIAGTLGAWGAFTLTLAMFTGGAKIPYIVMPIVFGGAVSVSAIYSSLQSSQGHGPSIWLWIGICGILVCTVIVAINPPHAPPAASKPPAESAATQHTPAKLDTT